MVKGALILLIILVAADFALAGGEHVQATWAWIHHLLWSGNRQVTGSVFTS